MHQSRSVIGVMSGSSLDGIDLALCRFDQTKELLSWSILEAKTFPFTPGWKQKLQKASLLGGYELMQLHADFGLHIGQIVSQWMAENKINADLLAVHGHTVFHDPARHFTTQIGSGAHIAALAKINTVTDFRQADVAHSGQGAPFAPVADRDLFTGYEGYLNLGGIVNISLADDRSSWKAWDIGPCNQALNMLAQKKGSPYDHDGQWAASGNVIPEMMRDLKKYYPSTGGNAFSLANETIQQTWLQFFHTSTTDISNLLATTTEAIAELIIEHIVSFRKSGGRILVTGGGAHNSFLLQRINTLGLQHGLRFEKPDDRLIDFKESLLFAYLGFLYDTNQPFGVHHFTGATQDSIGGALYKALP